MRTTTVIWDKQLGINTMENIMSKVQELLGDNWDYYESFFRLVDDDNLQIGQRKAVRFWPDLATAEAWVEFIQTLDTKPVSAVVDPE